MACEYRPAQPAHHSRSKAQSKVNEMTKISNRLGKMLAFLVAKTGVDHSHCRKFRNAILQITKMNSQKTQPGNDLTTWALTISQKSVRSYVLVVNTDIFSVTSHIGDRTYPPGVLGASQHEPDPRGPPHAVNGVDVANGTTKTPSIDTLRLSDRDKLPGLQATYLKDTQDYEPLTLADLGPDSFDLVPSNDRGNQGLSPSMLEQRCEMIFSDFHLHVILQDYSALQRFTEFITANRPKSLPLLGYYMSSMKAQAAMHLTNSIIQDLKPVSYHGVNLKFTERPAEVAESKELHDKIARAFHILARDDLSAYVTYQWMNIVESSMKQRVTGLLPSHLKE